MIKAEYEKCFVNHTVKRLRQEKLSMLNHTGFVLAGKSIDAAVIVKSFKKSWITSAVDGSEDGVLWNGSEGD